MDIRVKPDELVEFVAAIYRSSGVPDGDARLVAELMVQADLWGHQSHGVLRTGWCLARLKSGVMTAITRPETVVDAGAVAVIDAREGVGQVVTMHAAREAIRRAHVHGIGSVAVRNSNHFGTCMYYTRAGAEAGCVMLLTTNGGPAMAPWGGRKKIIGTNPWSLAVPAGRHPPFAMDMANTGGVFYPGEIEARNDACHRTEGLLLPADTMADLKRIAGDCGIACPFSV